MGNCELLWKAIYFTSRFLNNFEHDDFQHLAKYAQGIEIPICSKPAQFFKQTVPLAFTFSDVVAAAADQNI